MHATMLQPHHTKIPRSAPMLFTLMSNFTASWVYCIINVISTSLLPRPSHVFQWETPYSLHLRYITWLYMGVSLDHLYQRPNCVAGSQFATYWHVLGEGWRSSIGQCQKLNHRQWNLLLLALVDRSVLDVIEKNQVLPDNLIVSFAGNTPASPIKPCSTARNAEDWVSCPWRLCLKHLTFFSVCTIADLAWLAPRNLKEIRITCCLNRKWSALRNLISAQGIVRWDSN